MDRINSSMVYPNDWEEKKLGELGAFLKGKGISKGDTKETGYPCVLYGEIYTRHHNYIKQFYSFIDEETAKKSIEIKKDDILFAGSGETKEEIGKSVAYLDDSVAYAGGDIIILRTKGINNQYLAYTLNHGKLAIERAKLGQGHSVVHIYSKELANLSIKLPSKDEQQRIVSILSTWDKAIELKEKLIEHKKEQKKGLMERLLTSKQRLKGFEEEWELKKVKDIAEIYLGLTYTPKYVSEGVPFLSVKDLDGDKLDFSNTKYISREEFESSTSNAKPLKGDILFGRVGTLGNPIVLNEDMAFCIFVSLGFLRMKNESSLNYFVKYWMQSNLFKKQIESQVAGSSQKNLNTGWLKEFELKMPNLNEQKAIVKVLSGMDNEVNLLKQELKLLKQQRQALMQQLLTGKIRVKV
ncbi:restriction endonuclease subunit S [Ureibacillus sp. MALMAid1270]|uniref:restriction endonuclease subunit S n=1 Tax=Ureibacillus sp. MALMAid1270 TaxID=3411629 RepID=UPI003BA43A93